MQLSRIIGDESRFALEHRILNAALVTGVALSAICDITNYLDGLNHVIVLTTLLGGLIWAGLYWLSIAKEYYEMPLYVGSAVFLLLFTPVIWITNGGTLGSYPYLIILFCTMVATGTSGKRRWLFALWSLATVGALMAIEHKYPYIIRGYDSSATRFVDISFTIIITIVVNMLFAVVIVNNYNNERKKVEHSNERLQREMARRRLAEDALREREELYRDLVETSPDAITVIDLKGTIVMANHRTAELVGLGSGEDLIGRNVLGFVAPPYRYRAREHRKVIRRTKRIRSTQLSLLRMDGSSFAAEFSASLISSADGKPTVIVLVWRDITERKQMEDRLAYMATHDSLTDTANRYSLEQAIDQAIARTARGNTSALLLIDLDNFKLVNDTLGHAAGDEMLKTLVATLSASLRKNDLLARLGGDEFAILLDEVTAGQARVVAEKLRRAVDEMKTPPFNLTVSIGLVTVDGSLDAQKLLSLADTALYEAKEKGRNTVV